MLGKISWTVISKKGELNSTWIIWEKEGCGILSWISLVHLSTALIQFVVYKLYFPFWLFLSWPERNTPNDSYWVEMPNSRVSAFYVCISDALRSQLPGYNGKQLLPSAKYMKAWFVPSSISNVHLHGMHLKKAEMEPSNPILPVGLFWRYCGALRWSCIWG